MTEDKQKNKTNNTIITVGDLAKEICDKHNFETNIDVTKYILENITNETTLFFKASRSMKFEEIISNIKENIL